MLYPGVTTGIGSLPHGDLESAMAVIREYCPEMPHWPQLRSPRNGDSLMAAALSPLERVGLITGNMKGYPVIDMGANSFRDALAAFYEAYENEAACWIHLHEDSPFHIDLDSYLAFKDVLTDERNRWADMVALKGEVLGPLTLALNIVDGNGRAILHERLLWDVLCKNCAMNAAWQVKDLRRTGHPVLLMIDEPAMLGFDDCEQETVNDDDLQKGLQQIITAIQRMGGLAGVHVCGPADGALLFASGADIIGFDAYRSMDTINRSIPELIAFLERGGWLAWGIVPVTGAFSQETALSLTKRLHEQMSELTRLGVPEALLYRQTALTPACGMARLSEAEAEAVYGRLREVSTLWGWY
ncbi:hypothetical protein GTO89_15230 [Heliobacterium gestii]|uniref:Methionine synthase n=1 Tax=Heliomicrobium gestii TaxID=2699 RepID=A0A845LG34_HELGE|nr:hypothetical protein [Heliomicrobium gestii]MBM7868087.1 hypothetical protein [Heliomicrobium gestii]MZP44384.1 hypothetical protein [Heliomicrobium gestii]